jgi:hypothetical protein
MGDGHDMTWRILYDDGSVYTSDDGPPESAPGWGVLVVRQDGGHDSPLSNVDHYLWRRDRVCWIPVMHDGLVAYLTRFAPHITACVNGSPVPYPEWNTLAKQPGWLLSEAPN